MTEHELSLDSVFDELEPLVDPFGTICFYIGEFLFFVRFVDENEFVSTCREHESLQHIAPTRRAALCGIIQLVCDAEQKLRDRRDVA